MASGNPDYGFEVPTGGLDLVGAGPADIFLRSRVVGDIDSRYFVNYGGYQSWGPGSGTPDCYLYRWTAGLMRFWNKLEVGNTLIADASCLVKTLAVGDVGLTVTLLAGQTADAVQVKSSGGAVLFGVDKDGNAAAAGSFNAGSLQVNGPATIAGDLDLDAHNSRLSIVGAGTHQIELTGATSGRLGQDESGFFFASDTSGGAVRFLTNDGTLHEVMRVTSDQRVGIGNTAPGKALDVTGDVRASLQLISTVAIGTPPLAVTSTTEVVNLNADRVGGTEITNAAAVDQVLVGTGAGTAAWSASTSGLGYTLTLLTSSTGTSPADTTTYYVGTVPFRPADTTYSVVSGIIPKSGTLKRVFLRIRVNTAVGSAEDVNHYIRLNDTTDVNIGTAKYSVAAVVPLDAVVSQAVSAGDTVVLKIVTPAWVTNPTGVFWYAVLYIE